MRFPYVRVRETYYPIIPVILKSGRIEFKTDALIDSGASISVFQGSIAEYLGLDIESGERRIFQGIGGKIVGYAHPLTLVMRDLEFPCLIAFSNELVSSLNLIGREDFFEQFLITFDEVGKSVELTAR